MPSHAEMHTWTFYCHTMKLSGTCFLVTYLVYYYQNSCVVSFRNVLEYLVGLSRVVVVVVDVRSDWLFGKLYRKRELLWKIVHFEEIWRQLWDCVNGELSHRLWWSVVGLRRPYGFFAQCWHARPRSVSRKFLCLGFSRSLKAPKRRWARVGLSFAVVNINKMIFVIKLKLHEGRRSQVIIWFCL